MFRQVCYVSAANTSISDAELGMILDSAARANGPRQVTGLLAYGEGTFFQVIEGPRDCVEAVLAQLRRDPRHRAIQILRDAEIAERDFAGYPMAFRSADSEAVRQIAATLRSCRQPMPVIVAALGNPSQAAELSQMRLAA